VISLKPVDLENDVDTCYRLALDCEQAVVDSPDTTREEIASLLGSPDADLVDGTRKAVDEDGAAAGFISVEVDRTGREVMVDAYVHPDAADSTWDLLLGHARRFAEAKVAALPEDERAGWVMGGGSHSVDRRYGGALSRAGLTAVRRFHTMSLAFDPQSPPGRPALADDVTMDVVGDDPERLRAAHAVSNESFLEHWHYVSRSFDEFMLWARNSSFDPTQWLLASVDGTPAGVCIGNDRLAALGWSYVSTLGVLAPHRGRGLGRTMLQTFFADAYARGRVGVKLGVDTENSTGAPALYTAVGMVPSQIIDAWELPLGA
jgi:mycothiol synthase